MPLTTNAETYADATRSLTEFANLSLPGIRDQVGTMLRLIGRDGIFSTYTRHDITHVDAMLRMLDWLVPDETKKVMTPVDWLLVVLSIYLHDLGMAVTSAEFESRSSNEHYTSWRSTLGNTNEGQEYLARMHRMNDDERERFFYQEYVRKGHAQRIREWITGRHSRNWGDQVSPIATAVKELLDSTPTRFRETLGLVCESHHRADLDKTDKYQVVARFGNDPQAVANVQYAAILLRTVDLLHVTRDRTPSIDYETIKFSDPKSVDEWDKQLGAFSVGPRGRHLMLDKPETAVIVLNADFSEERPLFALQEYIAYADSEIRQSRRWAERTQSTVDGRDYHFPWRELEGDVRLEGIPPQPLKFELDRGRLLDLLVGHTLYNDPMVAIRELLQNGIDAVRFQYFRDRREARTNAHTAVLGGVLVTWNAATRMLSVEDNGIGMDRDTIEHNLMRVGSSYYNTPQFEADNKDFTPISRFGIGVLTCFMVSDDIEIVTRKGATGHRIRMTSVKSTYLLRELEAGDPLLKGIEPHGTRVSLRLRDTIKVDDPTVEQILRHWIVLPECRVEYAEPGQSPRAIGYHSAQEAVEEKQKEALQDGFQRRTREVVVKTTTRSPDEARQISGSFELAFAVSKGNFPEREFDSFENGVIVCIEGIRVAETLPGWTDKSVCAVLSVRGSRQFRTTVSRAGLEVDEGYHAVGEICAELLFSHVHDEVERISNLPGRPLSRAVSACAFLSTQLARNCDGPVLRVLQNLGDRQPEIIIEEVQEGATSRTLAPPGDVRSRPDFWTLEARAVDSLGTLSRDLGREFSLNEFLLAFAPDLVSLRYSPLLPEAHRHVQHVLDSHIPGEVQFSRRHQQTAIHWIRAQPTEDLTMKAFWKQDDAVTRELQVDLLKRFDRGYGRRRFLAFPYYVASIVGDDDEIQAVASRIIVAFRDDCELLKVWRRLHSHIFRLRKENGSYEVMLQVAALMVAFDKAVSKPEFEYEFNNDWRQLWRNAFRDLLEQDDIGQDLEADLDLFGAFQFTFDRRVLFDASRYWLDWNRTIF